MRYRIGRSISVYVKNFGKHVKRVVLRQETMGNALGDLSKDAGKLRRVIKEVRGSGEHLEAARLVEKGRRAYNEKDFKEAEDLFRQAIVQDAQYALAYTYLGYTLYRLDMVREAVIYLTKAVELDPGSDAAGKAERRLRSIRMKRDGLIADLEERVHPPK